MRYGLIGCGRISINHIKAAISNNLEIVAICDIVDEKMNNLLCLTNLQNNLKIKKYSNYKTMIDENKIDIISVATDSGTHAEISLYCISRNINVIIEKPIAMSIQDADKIIKESELKNVKVSVCHQNRFNLAVQEMKKALDSRWFGKISHANINIRWNRNKEYYLQSSWRGKWASDGGALMNQCIHGIDLIKWLVNDDIDEIYGVTSQRFHDYLETEDIGMAIIKFKNGIIASIEGTVNVYKKNLEETLYIFGETGMAKLGGTSCNNIDIWDFESKNKINEQDTLLKEITDNVYGNGHIKLFENMIDSIKNNNEPYVSAIDGKNALEIVLAIYKSQKLGNPVKFPIGNFSSIDMIGEFDYN